MIASERQNSFVDKKAKTLFNRVVFFIMFIQTDNINDRLTFA